MKYFLSVLAFISLQLWVNAQFVSRSFDQSYFLDANQTSPLFAGNDGNARIQTSGSFRKNIPIGTMSLDFFIPKLKTALYCAAENQRLGQMMSDFVNLGATSRFNVDNKVTLLFNANIAHSNFFLDSRSINSSYYTNPTNQLFEAKYLDAGIGAGVMYQNHFALFQVSNLLEGLPYTFKNAPLVNDLYPSSLLRTIRLTFGTSKQLTNNFCVAGNTVFSHSIYSRYSRIVQVNMTAKYRWVLMAVSYSSFNYLRLSIGTDICKRWKLVYGNEFTTSRLGSSSSSIHQIGVSLNITKPNAKHQLMPLLSVY